MSEYTALEEEHDVTTTNRHLFGFDEDEYNADTDGGGVEVCDREFGAYLAGVRGIDEPDPDPFGLRAYGYRSDVLDPADVWRAEGGRIVHRNDWPSYLGEAVGLGLVPHDLLRMMVPVAWAAADHPQHRLDEETWWMLFATCGYVVEYGGGSVRRGRRPTRPITLYRGSCASRQDGWSWSAKRSVARRFTVGQGTEPGFVYTATVEPWRLWMRCLSRGEHEYVLDTDGLNIHREGSTSTRAIPDQAQAESGDQR